MLNPNYLSLKKVNKYLDLCVCLCHLLILASGCKTIAIISVMQCILGYLALNVFTRLRNSLELTKSESTFCWTTKLVTMVKERPPRCDQNTEAINAMTLASGPIVMRQEFAITPSVLLLQTGWSFCVCQIITRWTICQAALLTFGIKV